MNEVLTAAVTVVLGSFVVVFGQIAQRFFIEPIQEQKRVIGEVAHAVVYYGNVQQIAKMGLRDEAHRKLRDLAAQLLATRRTVPYYGLFEARGWVEKGENVVAAYTGLIGWSHSVSMGDDQTSYRRRSEVIKALGLPPS